MRIRKELAGIFEALNYINSEVSPTEYSAIDLMEYCMERSINAVVSVCNYMQVADDPFADKDEYRRIDYYCATQDPIERFNVLLYLDRRVFEEFIPIVGENQDLESSPVEGISLGVDPMLEKEVFLKERIEIYLVHPPTPTDPYYADKRARLVFPKSEIERFISAHSGGLSEDEGRDQGSRGRTQDRRELVLRGWLAGKGYAIGDVLTERRSDVWDALGANERSLFPPKSPSTIKQFFDHQQLVSFSKGRK